MLFQRYMTGRGNLGYGFRAQTSKVPSAPYQKLRAADTGDTKRLLLEIMTTSYHELAAIGSCYDREQANGYTDILMPEAGGEDWEKLLDNPGRLLYLPHIGKAEFLETSNKGKTVSLGNGSPMELPPISHQWDGRFQIDDDTMADLIADVWYAASMRLTVPQKPGSWPVINIQLTDENERDNTLDIGREFYCNVLMPALPRALRSIISVSIGGHFSDVSNPANGGAAAVLITLPDEKTEMVPGTYFITPTQARHQVLNPLQDAENWRNFGRAVMQYARNRKMEAVGAVSYLNDFFAVSELLLSKPEYENFRRFTANWPYAYLLYNAHLNAEAAAKQQGDYAETVHAEELLISFNENVWDSADPSVLTAAGIPESATRACYVALEQHMLTALMANRRIRISEERYEALMQRAFTLPQVNGNVRDTLRRLYDEVLLRGTAEEGSNALQMLLEMLRGQNASLLRQQQEKLADLMQRAWQNRSADPDREHHELLVQYAQWGRDECEMVTRFVVELLNKGVSCSEVCMFRAVQSGDKLDRALLTHVGKNTKAYLEKAACKALDTYARAAASGEAMEEKNLRMALADSLKEYISKNAGEYRQQLRRIGEVFDEIGMGDSAAALESIIACMKSARNDFDEDDVPFALAVLQHGSEEQVDTLLECLPEMFRQSVIGNQSSNLEEPQLVNDCWLELMRLLPDGVKVRLHAGFVEILQECITFNPREAALSFAALKLNSGKDEIPMQVLCTCMERHMNEFSQAEAECVLPVLRSGKPEAERMAAAVLKSFANNLPELMSIRDDPENQPWRMCAEAYQPLAASMQEELYRYAENEAAQLVDYLDRVMTMMRAYGCTDTAKTMQIFSRILTCRANRRDDDAALTEQDMAFVREFNQKKVNEEEQEELARALHLLFEKELPNMTAESNRRRWMECINLSKLGGALKRRVVDTVHDYVLKNQDELCYELDRAMALYTTFGVPGEKRMQGWCALLCTLAKNEAGTQILRGSYVNQLAPDMLRQVAEESIDSIVGVFRKDLEFMLQGQGLAEWTKLNQKLADAKLRRWKEKGQEALIDFVAWCKQEIGEENTEDHLDVLLEMASGMGWVVKDVREALTDYMAALKRSELSRTELENLLKLHVSGGREIELGVNDVFSRVVPRLLQTSGDKRERELRLWSMMDGEIDLHDGFRKAILQMTAMQDEKFVLSLISMGGVLLALQPAAVEQAIDTMGRRKNEQADGSRNGLQLLSDQEHQAVLNAIRKCDQRQQLLARYAELLSYEPVDPESKEYEKQLRKRIREMRLDMLHDVDTETAVGITQESAVWQKEVQQMLLDKLRQMTQESDLSFQSLCALPERWNQSCSDWPFAEFMGLTRFIADREMMEDAVCQGAQQVIAHTPLEELKQNLLQDADNWYAKALNRLVMQRIGEDAAGLAEECENPREMEELLDLLKQQGCGQQGTGKALQLVLKGNHQENLFKTMTQIQSLDYHAQEVALKLLDKAVFGQQRAQWHELWAADECSSRIPMAAICFLSGTEKKWQSFLSVVLEDTQMDKKAMAQGVDPAQKLMFAATVLCDMGMAAEADELPEQLKNNIRTVYSYVRGLGRRRRELAAVKSPEAWQSANLPESMYKLIFNKR